VTAKPGERLAPENEEEKALRERLAREKEIRDRRRLPMFMFCGARRARASAMGPATFSAPMVISAKGSKGSATRSRRTSRQSVRPPHACAKCHAIVLGCMG
jgi:hypothetical protein